MIKLMEYRGYQSSVNFCDDSNIFYGIVIGIKGSISFHADTVAELEAEFKESIDDYLLCCEEEGWEVEKPYIISIDFNLTPDMNKRLQSLSNSANLAPDKIMEEALEQYLATKAL